MMEFKADTDDKMVSDVVTTAQSPRAESQIQMPNLTVMTGRHTLQDHIIMGLLTSLLYLFCSVALSSASKRRDAISTSQYLQKKDD
jgi:hypothetical protein